MKFICQKCKNMVSDSDNFCSHCGSEFKTLNDAKLPAFGKDGKQLARALKKKFTELIKGNKYGLLSVDCVPYEDGWVRHDFQRQERRCYS